MNCIKCGLAQDDTKPGFVICPQCHTVNMNGVTEHSAPIPHFEPLVPHHMSANTKQAHKQTKVKLRLLKGGAIACVLIAIVVGFLFFQNNQAQASIKLARRYVATSRYNDAVIVLKKAQKQYVVFGGTKKQLSDLIKQDTAWQAASSNYSKASILVGQGKFDDAKVLLAKVPSDFPEYARVEDLNVQIKKQIAAAEAAAAAATAAAEAAKQAALPKATTTVPKTVPKAVFVPTGAGKRFTNELPYLTNLNNAKTIAEAQAALQAFLDQYKLVMSISSISPSYYAASDETYTILTEPDLPNLKVYGALFIDEWAKYPTDWVTNSKLKGIAFAKNLAVGGTLRAAAPDPIGEEMYYDPGYTYATDYSREVIHHEYDHLFTYNYFNSYSPSDPTWMSYNKPGFAYGNGGASCYVAGNTCLTGQHPIAGFSTGYGASAIEEDKAEIFGYLMTDTYYKQMKGWLTTDANLANKVTNYKAFIASHSPSMSGSYFDDVNP